MKSLSYRTIFCVGPTDGDIGPYIAIDTQDCAGITDRIAPDLYPFSQDSTKLSETRIHGKVVNPDVASIVA